MNAPRQRAPRLPGEERRRQFVEVAAGIIGSGGVDAVNMESVAAAADVSKGLGYAYFENRWDLVVAVLDREVMRLRAAMEEAICHPGTFEEKLRSAVRAWLDAVADRGRLLANLLTASQIYEPLKERRQAFFRGLEEDFGLIAADEFGIAKDRAVASAAILVAGLRGLVERWALEPGSRAMLEETFVTLTLGGLRALAGDPGDVLMGGAGPG